MDYSKYQKMQADYYNNPELPFENVIGNVDWHEKVPYETLMLFKHGDMRRSVVPFSTFADKSIALDFGCGPGRMIPRMQKIFYKVDGCDISPRLLEEAKRRNPNSDFYPTNGDDAGNAPENHYDFIYSTISMQHIAVRSIRLNILRSLAKKLKDNGSITIQMGFSNQNWEYDINMPWYRDVRLHARYDEDKIDAKGTNAHCDCTITPNDLPLLVSDFNDIFKDTAYWFYDCSLMWHNFEGAKHAEYWASHWIFINARKK